MINNRDSLDPEYRPQDRHLCSLDFGISEAFMALSALGTMGQMFGGASQANQQARAYQDQANAIEAQKRLVDAADQKEEAFALAKNQATTEAGGISSGSGSPLEFELENAFNAGMTRAVKRWGFDLQKRNALLNANSAKQQGVGAIWEGIGALGSNLGKWYTASKSSNPFAGQKADISWSGYT